MGLFENIGIGPEKQWYLDNVENGKSLFELNDEFIKYNQFYLNFVQLKDNVDLLNLPDCVSIYDSQLISYDKLTDRIYNLWKESPKKFNKVFNRDIFPNLTSIKGIYSPVHNKKYNKGAYIYFEKNYDYGWYLIRKDYNQDYFNYDFSYMNKNYKIGNFHLQRDYGIIR